MSQDEELLLGDLAELTAGPSGTLLDSLHDGPEGVPVISPPDLTDHHTVDPRRLRRVPESATSKLARFALQEGDLLIVRQGALGRLALIGPEHTSWFYGSSCIRIRPRTDVILPEYLMSYLAYPPVQERLLDMANPGTVPALNAAVVAEVPVTLPTLARQRIVADVLAEVDTQIRIQQQIADRLVALRPSIFGEFLQKMWNE